MIDWTNSRTWNIETKLQRIAVMAFSALLKNR